MGFEPAARSVELSYPTELAELLTVKKRTFETSFGLPGVTTVTKAVPAEVTVVDPTPAVHSVVLQVLGEGRAVPFQ
jgi:hypothetical protein